MFAKIGLLTHFFLLITMTFAASESAPKKKSVVIFKAVKSDLFDQFAYPAIVTSEVSATVQAEAQGIVSNIDGLIGSKVKKNQTILTLKNTDPGYNYRAFKVTAPVDGVISKVNVTKGTLVKRGDALFNITDPDNLKILIEIPVTDLDYIKNNSKGELSLHYLDAPLQVEVTGVSPVLDSSTGTASARLKLSNPEQSGARIGAIGKVKFKSNIHQGIAIPEHAVVYEGRKPQLRLVQNKLLRRVDVVLGKKRSGMIEITSGLKDGDSVVERVSGFIADGEEVEVKE